MKIRLDLIWHFYPTSFMCFKIIQVILNCVTFEVFHNCTFTCFNLICVTSVYHNSQVLIGKFTCNTSDMSLNGMKIT